MSSLDPFQSAPDGCTDPRQGRRLAHYELDALTGRERRDFLEHLLHCPACHEEVFAFERFATMLRPPGRRERRDAEVPEAVEGPDRGGTPTPSGRLLTAPGRWRRWLPAASAAAVLMVAAAVSLIVARDNNVVGSAGSSAGINEAQRSEASVDSVPGEVDPGRATQGAPPLVMPSWSAPAWETPSATEQPLLRSAGTGPMIAGRQAWQLGDYATAANHLEAAVRLDDQLVDAWFYRGVALLLERQPGEALHPLRRAQQLAGGDRRLESSYYLGVALTADGQPEEARSTFEGLLLNAPEGLWKSQARRFLDALEAAPNSP